MAPKKKLSSPITLFAAVEARQHEALRLIAFNERRSIADVVREAIDDYVKDHRSLIDMTPAKPARTAKRAARG